MTGNEGTPGGRQEASHEEPSETWEVSAGDVRRQRFGRRVRVGLKVQIQTNCWKDERFCAGDPFNLKSTGAADEAPPPIAHVNVNTWGRRMFDDSDDVSAAAAVRGKKKLPVGLCQTSFTHFTLKELDSLPSALRLSCAKNENPWVSNWETPPTRRQTHEGLDRVKQEMTEWRHDLKTSHTHTHEQSLSVFYSEGFSFIALLLSGKKMLKR